MTSALPLPELQRAFSAWLLGEPAPELESLVAGRGLEPEARMQIYRNIVFNNLTEALATAYPAIKALVGESFFDAAAARYIRRHPSRRGCLQEYGAGFADLLASMPEAGGLPYLPDVARLEWLRQSCALSPMEQAAEPATLMILSEADRLRARLQLQSALNLMRSAYPVLDIWLYCQQPTDERLNIDGDGQAVLVWRSGAQVAMQAVDEARFRFVSALTEGKNLAQAYSAGVRADPAFDAANAIAWLFHEGMITGCGI